MEKHVSLTIDGKQVEVPERTLIVDAAKKIGIDIPVFCYHPKMEPVGMCRMCLVEIGRPARDRSTGDWLREADGSLKIQFGPKLETACTTPVSEGMVVVGYSEKVQAARKDILEFLLTSHPLDCPICDKGGECPLQNLTIAFGPGQSRFLLDEKAHLGKHVPLGELIMLDRERCIQCARCTRFQGEIVDDPVIGFFQRGRNLEIVTFSEPGFDSYYSGNTTDICPVGALTTADFRFEARPWELKSAASICPHCPVGCNTTLNTRREARAGGKSVIKRVMPRQNEMVNEIWLCDKGRFAYHYTQSEDRLTDPLVRKNGELVAVSWEEALTSVADGFRQAGDGLLALGSGRLSNEDLFNLRKLAEGVGGRAAATTPMAGGDLVAKVGVGGSARGSNFSQMGPESAILVVACDLQEEAPIWWLRVKQAADRGCCLMVVNPRVTKLDKHATHVYHYTYGAEAATVLAMVNALSAKRPDLGEAAPRARELDPLAAAFGQAENAVIIYGSEGLGLEGSQALAQACANLLIATNHTGRPNNGLIAAWGEANGQGAWDMGLRPVPDLQTALESAKALYVVAADPAGDDPALAEAVRRSGFLVVQDLFLTETARLANVVLPAQAFPEREGTYTNGERRVQRYYPAVPVWARTRADYTIIAQIGQLLSVPLESRSPLLVMEKYIAAQVPDYAGVTYRKLAEVEEQWPIIGRADLYYGGTTYGNGQGLGVQLPTAAQRGEATPLGWIQPPAAAAAGEGDLLAVPITRLYDRARTVLPSHLLRLRIPEPYVAINTADAGRLGIEDGQPVEVRLGEVKPDSGTRSTRVTAWVDERVPAGVMLIPRSMGVPIWAPVQAQVKVVQPVAAR